MAFKSADAAYMETVLRLSESGAEMATVRELRTKETTQITIHNTETNTDIVFNIHKTSEGYTLDGEVSGSGMSFGKLDATIVLDGKKFKNLTARLDVQGMSFTLSHEVTDEGFGGALMAPMGGKLNWKGTVSGKELTSLVVDGEFQGSAVKLDLVKPENGELITGPLTVSSGDVVLASAVIGLQVVGNEKFGLTVDNIVAPNAEIFKDTHFEIFATGKNSDTTKKVAAPKDTTPLSELMNKMNALTPDDTLFDGYNPEDDSFSGGEYDAESGSMDAEFSGGPIFEESSDKQ